MASATETEQALNGITKRIIGEPFTAGALYQHRAASEGAVRDTLRLYRSFLLDPRGAVRAAFAPYANDMQDFQRALLTHAGDPEAPSELKAAAELMKPLLSIASANGITAETIEEDRRAARFAIPDKYSHYEGLVSDATPEPATEQQDGYQSARNCFHSATAAGGPLHGLRNHPSVQFMLGWLGYKIGDHPASLQSAMKHFTAAAAHPMLRISCVLLRGLCLFYLGQDSAAVVELNAGLQQQEDSAAVNKAENSLVAAAHSALAIMCYKTATTTATAKPVAVEAEAVPEVPSPEVQKALDHYKKAASPITASVRLLSQARAVLAAHLPDDPLVKAQRMVVDSWGASTSAAGSVAGEFAVWGAQRATKMLSGVSRLEPLYEYDSMAIILKAEAENKGQQRSLTAEWATAAGEDFSHMQGLPGTGGYCQGCGKLATQPDVQLMRCGRCRGFWYCSKKCQRADWPFHKTVCRQPG